MGCEHKLIIDGWIGKLGRHGHGTSTYGVTYINISWSGRIFKERGVSTKELKLEWQTNDAEVYGSMLWGVWRTVDVSRPVWYLVVYSAARGSHNGRICCKRIAFKFGIYFILS